MELRKVARFGVYVFWPALFITLLLTGLTIFGVQVPAYRWWDILFIPFIIAAIIMIIIALIKKRIKSFSSDDNKKDGEVATIFFFISYGIILLAAHADGIFMPARTGLLRNEILFLSSPPALIVVIRTVYGVVRGEGSMAYCSSALTWAGATFLGIFLSYAFWFSAIYGSLNLPLGAILTLAIISVSLSFLIWYSVLILIEFIKLIIWLHRYAFSKIK